MNHELSSSSRLTTAIILPFVLFDGLLVGLTEIPITPGTEVAEGLLGLALMKNAGVSTICTGGNSTPALRLTNGNGSFFGPAVY